MAPEYALWGHLTYKADVYSFGVVALEIVAGKNNNMKHLPYVSLVDWVISQISLFCHFEIKHIFFILFCFAFFRPLFCNKKGIWWSCWIQNWGQSFTRKRYLE